MYNDNTEINMIINISEGYNVIKKNLTGQIFN